MANIPAAGLTVHPPGAMVRNMKAFLILLVCLATCGLAGWVIGPKLVDRAVDRFADRVRDDPQLAGALVNALAASPAIRAAVAADLKQRGLDLDRLDIPRLQQSLQLVTGLLTSPQFQRWLLQVGLNASLPAQTTPDLRVQAERLLGETRKRLVGTNPAVPRPHLGVNLEKGLRALGGAQPSPVPTAS